MSQTLCEYFLHVGITICQQSGQTIIGHSKR